MELSVAIQLVARVETPGTLKTVHTSINTTIPLSSSLSISTQQLIILSWFSNTHSLWIEAQSLPPIVNAGRMAMELSVAIQLVARVETPGTLKTVHTSINTTIPLS